MLDSNDELSHQKRNPFQVGLTICLTALLVAFVYGLFQGRRVQREAERNPPRTMHPYRLPVKLALDPEASKISRDPKRIRLSDLLKLPRGAQGQTGRIVPLETQVWEMEVMVTRIEFEPDGDVQFEIEEGGEHSLMEIPEPSLMKQSRLYAEIARLRAGIDSVIDPRHREIALRRKAIVQGVGFAGYPSRKDPTGVELYPLLSFRWKD